MIHQHLFISEILNTLLKLYFRVQSTYALDAFALLIYILSNIDSDCGFNLRKFIYIS